MRSRKQIPWSALAVALLLLARAGMLWTPHDPMAQEFRERALEGPSLDHLLGIDGLVFVGHGRSDSLALVNSLKRAQQAVDAGLLSSLKDAIQTELSQPAKED